MKHNQVARGIIVQHKVTKVAVRVYLVAHGTFQIVLILMITIVGVLVFIDVHTLHRRIVRLTMAQTKGLVRQ